VELTTAEERSATLADAVQAVPRILARSFRLLLREPLFHFIVSGAALFLT